MITQLFFGQDVELNLVTNKGEWVPPDDELLEKYEFRGFKQDNHAFEFAMPPARSLSTLLREAQIQMALAQSHIDGKFNPLPMQKLPKKLFDYPHDYGCRPDIPLLDKVKGPTKEELAEYAKKDEDRPYGGHLHISGYNLFTRYNGTWNTLIKLFKEYQDSTPENRDECLWKLRNCKAWNNFNRLAKMLERIVLDATYTASLAWGLQNPDIGIVKVIRAEEKRRSRYGQAGHVRPKLYKDDNNRIMQGVEIRSPSPIWIMLSPDSEYVSKMEQAIYDSVHSYTRVPENINISFLDKFPNVELTFRYDDVKFSKLEVDYRPEEKEINMEIHRPLWKSKGTLAGTRYNEFDDDETLEELFEKVGRG